MADRDGRRVVGQVDLIHAGSHGVNAVVCDIIVFIIIVQSCLHCATRIQEECKQEDQVRDGGAHSALTYRVLEGAAGWSFLP